MEQKTVRYRVLDPRAKAPVYATPGAAAADLCAVLDAPLTLSPGERTMIPTGLAIELPDTGWYQVHDYQSTFQLAYFD